MFAACGGGDGGAEARGLNFDVGTTFSCFSDSCNRRQKFMAVFGIGAQKHAVSAKPHAYPLFPDKEEEWGSHAAF